MKKTNKKTKKIMTKCPHCGLDLVKDAGIGYSQAGEMLYDVSSDGENLEYEQDSDLQIKKVIKEDKKEAADEDGWFD